MTTHQGLKNGNGKKKNSQKRTSSSSDDESEDISIIGRSLSVSVNGVRQLIRAVLEGTPDFQDILYNDCSLIFECKLCRNLFRSVANFISHKRRYCKKPSSFHDQGCYQDELDGANPVPVSSTSDETDGKDISSSQQNGVEAVSPPRLKSKELAQSVICRLEDMPQTTVAKYQTVFTENLPPRSIRQELECLDDISSPREIILTQDGVAKPTDNGKAKHKCTSCDATFSTVLALRHHLTLSHRTRTCYSCPLCKSYCSTPWAVSRHLSKIHNKSTEQVRRLRASVLDKTVEKELHQPRPTIQETRMPTDTRTEEEKWMAEFVGSLRCSVCMKTFNRHAALAVHSIKCKPDSKTKQTDRSPSADRPQICNHCGKQFTRRAALRVHVQTCKNEIGAQERTCKYCHKVFLRRKQLQVHSTRCPEAPAPLKSPNRHPIYSPSKLLIVHRNPTTPSDIQVRRDFNIAPYTLSRLNISPFAGRLESVVQKLREGPMFCNETISIMTVQSAPSLPNGPTTSDKNNEGVISISTRMPSVPTCEVKNEIVDVKNETLENALNKANSNVLNKPCENGSRDSHEIIDDESDDNECLPEVTSPFRGFDPISYEDQLEREKIKSLVKKMDTQLAKFARNGIVTANFTPINGIEKHILQCNPAESFFS